MSGMIQSRGGVALALALFAGGGMANAQEFTFEPSVPVLDECLSTRIARDDRIACIGQGAAHCIARYGWATPVEAACYAGEAEYWEERLMFLGYPPEDGAAGAAAAEAWRAFVAAECDLAAARFGEGTGQGSARAECRMRTNGMRNMSMEEIGWGG